jgi:hypothetical protein
MVALHGIGRELVMRWAALFGFLASIPAANQLIGNAGECIPHGPCVVPVGFGLAAHGRRRSMRRPRPSKASKEGYVITVWQSYAGCCPCCQKEPRLVDPDGLKIAGVFDHWTDNLARNEAHLTWLICQPCNDGFSFGRLLRWAARPAKLGVLACSGVALLTSSVGLAVGRQLGHGFEDSWRFGACNLWRIVHIGWTYGWCSGDGAADQSEEIRAVLTERQIAWAARHGPVGHRLDPAGAPVPRRS